MRGRPGRRCLALGFAALMALSPLTPTYGRTHQVRAGSVTQHRAARAARTAVTVVVRNCPECTVQAVHYVPAEGSPWWSHAQRVGSRGRVRFHVPARRTEGMTFFVDAPWHGSTGSAALMVARYDDLATGSRVDHTTARRARHGAPCWAGTTGARARLVLRVERFRARTVTGQRSFHPRVYSVRTLASWPPSDLTWKGSVGAQDAFACARPTVVPRAPAAHGQGTTTLTLRTDRCEGCLVRIGQWTDGQPSSLALLDAPGAPRASHVQPQHGAHARLGDRGDGALGGPDRLPDVRGRQVRRAPTGVAHRVRRRAQATAGLGVLGGHRRAPRDAADGGPQGEGARPRQRPAGGRNACLAADATAYLATHACRLRRRLRVGGGHCVPAPVTQPVSGAASGGSR